MRKVAEVTVFMPSPLPPWFEWILETVGRIRDLVDLLQPGSDSQELDTLTRPKHPFRSIVRAVGSVGKSERERLDDLASDLAQLEVAIHEVNRAAIGAHSLIRHIQRLVEMKREDSALCQLSHFEDAVLRIAVAWSEFSASVTAILASTKQWPHS
jgi:hypothetical protein